VVSNQEQNYVLHGPIPILTSKYGPEAGDMLSGQQPCFVNEQQPIDICLRGQSICFKKSSVADPESLSRILDLGSWFPDPGSRILDPGSWFRFFAIPDPGSEFFPPRIPDPDPQH
jgi:hypothetical protein